MSRRRVLRRAAAAVVAAVLCPPAFAASGAQAQVDPQPDYLRTSPGAEELVFVRANDLVTLYVCGAIATCVEVTVTCGQASEDMRSLREAGERARRQLTAAEVFGIGDDLDGSPARPQTRSDSNRRSRVRLSDFLVRLKEAGVLALPYAFINDEIDPSDPDTFRDPDVTELLEKLYGPDGAVEDWIDEVDEPEDLSASPTGPLTLMADGTLSALLPLSAQEELDGLPQADPSDPAWGGFLQRVRQALQVDLAPVRPFLTLLFERLNLRGLHNWNLHFDLLWQADELPHSLASEEGSSAFGIGALLDLLGLDGPKVRHVTDDIRVIDEHGTELRSLGAHGAIASLERSCREHYIRADANVGYADAAGARYVSFERAFASIAPVDGRSEEVAAVPLYGVAVYDGDGNVLYQDGEHRWYRIPSATHSDSGRRRLEILDGDGMPTDPPTYRWILATSLRLEFDAVADRWNVLDWTALDDEGIAEAATVATHAPSDVQRLADSDLAPARAEQRLGGHPLASSILGGGITVTALGRLGEAVLEYCLRHIYYRDCSRSGRLTVVVEPEGWNDARAVANDDGFRVLVNRATGWIVVMQELAGDRGSAGGEVVELGGTSYGVLERLCCVPEDYHWTVDVVLPVMGNDGARFYKDDDPLDRLGKPIPSSRLATDGRAGENLAGCDNDRYCSYLRPRPLGAPRLRGGGDASVLPGLGVSPYYRSLELRLSSVPEAPGPAPDRTYVEGTYTFDYCLAHREGRCGRPSPCTRVTYLEPPRAPNATGATMLGLSSLADVPVGFFEASDGCAETTGTVTVTVEVYLDENPDDVPPDVWSPDGDPPAVTGPPPEEKQCYYPDKEAVSDPGPFAWDDEPWELDPASDAAPQWCFLPEVGIVNESDVCVLEAPFIPGPDEYYWTLDNVRPSSSSRWLVDPAGTPQRRAAGGGQRYTSRADPLFLVGNPLTEGPWPLCEGARLRIVGVWGTHVGADNWRFSRAAVGPESGQYKDCTGGLSYQNVYMVEWSCRRERSTGFLDQMSNVLSESEQAPSDSRQWLSDAWHERLAAVKPCVGEAHCDVWVPPLPGWYQVRIEVDVPEVPPSDAAACHQLVVDEGGARSRFERNPRRCVMITGTPPNPVVEEDLRHEARQFVFDELIWVESPYLAP